MSMNDTPSGDRLVIGLFGPRNAGKSSIINALTSQELAVTSPVAGTTTDPVRKAMELLPIGPVVLIDTAGLGDQGELGELRVKKTLEELRRCDLAVVVTNIGDGPDTELEILEIMRKRGIPAVRALNFCDDGEPSETVRREVEARSEIAPCYVSAITGYGIEELKQRIIEAAPKEEERNLLAGLLLPGENVVFVVPIDKAAPKGRLILPQQQAIRAALDMGAVSCVCQPETLAEVLGNMRTPPALVVTDSQAFSRVSEIVPREIPLTSFSILFARKKGDFEALCEGAQAIGRLPRNGKVLILEGCTHHRQDDDIGTVKIPRLIRKARGEDVRFDWGHGRTMPEEIGEYDLVIHCGACMLNRREMQYRIGESKAAGVPITNYGMAIAYVLGILPRALEPFRL